MAKTSNSIWRLFPRFSEDVSEEELNALIQKAIPEKTKITRKYDLKNLKDKKKKNLKYQIDSFTRRNSRWCIRESGKEDSKKGRK